MKIGKVIGVVLVLVFLFGLGFYFTVINNIFASKPELEKPNVDVEKLMNNPGTQVIFEEHIEYLANGLGSYKLHDYSGEDAIIVFEMTDVGKSFALIKNGNSEIVEEVFEEYDLIVKGSQMVIIDLLESEDLVGSLKEEVESGNVIVEIVSDEKTLAMKGFLSIYESLK